MTRHFLAAHLVVLKVLHRVYIYLALVRAHSPFVDVTSATAQGNHRVEFCRSWGKKRTKLKDRSTCIAGRRPGGGVPGGTAAPAPCPLTAPRMNWRGGATRWRPPWHTRAAPSGDAGRGGAPMMCCDERQAAHTVWSQGCIACIALSAIQPTCAVRCVNLLQWCSFLFAIKQDER